jgi:hypothetical protein
MMNHLHREVSSLLTFLQVHLVHRWHPKRPVYLCRSFQRQQQQGASTVFVGVGEDYSPMQLRDMDSILLVDHRVDRG